MFLILRGHIRNSFDNELLLDFVNDLIVRYSDIKIIIHTWDVFSNSLSWRYVPTNNRPVTENIIMDYFKNINNYIKKIIIENDKNIPLIGNTSGTINGNNMPLIGWKNYIYGKYKAMDYIIKNKLCDSSELIINTRLDLMSNSNIFTKETIFEFLDKNINNVFTKNLFMFDYEKAGIDNFYIGNKLTMYKIALHFHNNLDKIIAFYPHIINQELLIFKENNRIFDE